MGHRAYCFVSGIFFSLVALAHLLRIVVGMPVQIDGLQVPMYVSWVGFLVPSVLALWAFRSSSERNEVT